jgi:hypothetical protein
MRGCLRCQVSSYIKKIRRATGGGAANPSDLHEIYTFAPVD